MPSTRWGEAILRLLAERRWTRRRLAREAHLQPKTLTNLLRYGRHADTDTLSRIAGAFEVDLVELFATPDQATLLRTYRDPRMTVAASQLFRYLEETVRDMASRAGAGAQQSAGVEQVVDTVVRSRVTPRRRRRPRPRPKRQ